MRKNLFIIAALFALFLANPGTEARCNTNKQPGTTETFELPNIPQGTPPFRFEEPDPARTLPAVPYSIDPESKTVFLVGVSGRLSPERAQEVQEAILRLVQESMCRPHDVMVIWNADPISRIATFRNGDRVQDCSPKWLKFKVANNQHEIGHLNRHFQKLREANHDGIADLNAPGLAHFLGQEFHEHDHPNRVMILFGSAIHVDREDSGSSLHTAYPTVGMLRAPLSPFSTRSKASYLGNTVAHWIIDEGDFRNSIHHLGLQSFWSAFFRSQNSPLLTFSPDTRISERVLNPGLPAIPAYVDDLNPGFVSVETTKLDDIFGPISPRNTSPSAVERGSLRLGLMFDERRNVDLDIHVVVRGSTERLSFRTPRTEFGRLRKRFDTGWEEVRMFGEVALDDVEVWANFYAGRAPSGGAQGELRISFAGQAFRAPIAFPRAARIGNKGDEGSPDHWVPIDLSAVVRGRN